MHIQFQPEQGYGFGSTDAVHLHLQGAELIGVLFQRLATLFKLQQLANRTPDEVFLFAFELFIKGFPEVVEGTQVVRQAN